MNPRRSNDLNRLRNAISASRRDLEPARVFAKDATRLFLGRHAKKSSDQRQPINVMELATTTIVYQVVPKCPQLSITTPFRSFVPYAAELEIATNHYARKLEVDNTMRIAAMQAVFSLGIVMVGLDRDSGMSLDMDGFRTHYEKPFISPVLFEDWVHDTAARHWQELTFMGHRYRLPLEYVLQSRRFKNKKGLAASIRANTNESGDSRADALDNPEAEITDMIDLWDIYLPAEGLILTLPLEDETRVLATAEWDGPETGPYHPLWFIDAPDRVMPLPPAVNWKESHDTINELARKLRDQALRQKSWTGIRGGVSADGNTLLDVEDGDVRHVEDPNGAREFKSGGPQAETVGFVTQLLSWFNYTSGNMNLLGGYAASSGTLGQDQILQQNAGKRLSDMQHKTRKCIREVLTSLAYYLHTDPLIEVPLEKTIPGTNERTPFSYSPELRSGDFLDYNFSLEPYSQAEPTPSEQLQTLSMLLERIIFPLAGEMAKQGVQVDVPNLVRTIGKLSNFDQLDTILSFSTPSPYIDEPIEHPLRPATSHRVYERVNTTPQKPFGMDERMMQQLMAGGRGAPSQPGAQSSMAGVG